MITPSVVADIAARLADSPWGGRRSLVEDEARRLGVTPNTLYAELRNFRGRTRKVRADRGAHRSVSKESVLAVAAIKAACTDTLAHRRIPTEVAIEMAVANGKIESGSVTRASFDRIALRDRMFGLRHIYSRFQAKRSNQLHHVDSSQSKYLRVVGKTEDGDWLLAPRMPEYSRKRSAEPLGLWATGVMDDRSRVGTLVYDVAPGESARLVCSALIKAWSPDPRNALRGMPEKLLCDHGPLRRSQEGQGFCDSLGVEYMPRMPNNPEAGGKMERTWRTLISRFELAFKANPELRLTLTDLNRMASSYMEERNGRRHPWMLDKTRLAVYAAALDQEMVRYAPERAEEAIWHEDYRKVGTDSLLRYENKMYLVPDNLAGRTVRILRGCEGFVMAEFEGENYPMKPFAPHDAGEYKDHKDTPARRLEKSAADLRLDVLPHQGERDVFHLHTGPRAEIATPFDEPRFVNKEEALDAFCDWLHMPYHTMSPVWQELLNKLFADERNLFKRVVQDLVSEARAMMAQGAG